MKKPVWETFQTEKLKELFENSKTVIDIGGGLRVKKEKNNRYNPDNEWLRPFIDSVDYKVLDPVPDYHPDIVGDIHDLPFEDNSIDAIICMAVLEHVKNPFKAVSEIHRVLKPNGTCFIFVPFLYYYHPLKGYYGDYWRFTTEGLDEMFKSFTSMEKKNVRGAIGTIIRVTPLGRYRALERMSYFLDKIFKKLESNQTSGYYILLKK